MYESPGRPQGHEVQRGPPETPKYRQQTFRQRYFGGIKKTLRAFTIVAILILIINIIWLLHAKTKYGITMSCWDDMQTSAPKWERLDNKARMEACSNLFLTSRRNVVLISSATKSSITNTTNSVLRYGSSDYTKGLDGNWWICSLGIQDGANIFCNPRQQLATADSWKGFDYPIEYGLSEPKKDICSVQFSLSIMWVVISFNAAKVVAMIWILFCFDAEKLLASVGDAAALFLTIDDPTTLGMCLANKRDLRRFWGSRGNAQLYNFRRRRWGPAVSIRRCVMFLLLMIAALLLVAIFGGWGFSHIKKQGIAFDPGSLWSLGFGAINQNTLVFAGNADDGTGAVPMAIIANIPQVILAGIYVIYMGIMTSMFISVNYSAFASKSQTLMVSSAVGKHRGTWLISAPLGYGLVLFGLHTLLHWFVSQSIFVVQLVMYNKDGQPDTQWETLSNCGYSPVAIICSVVAAVILLLSAVIFMLRRFPAGSPPVASTSSAAISAACHPVMRFDSLIYTNLRWGVDGGFGNEIQHCSWASAEGWNHQIQGPQPGVLYAGLEGKRLKREESLVDG